MKKYYTLPQVISITIELFLNSLKFKVILVHGKEHLNDRADLGLLIHSKVSLNSD